jgi:hypothetical protein
MRSSREDLPSGISSPPQESHQMQLVDYNLFCIVVRLSNIALNLSVSPSCIEIKHRNTTPTTSFDEAVLLFSASEICEIGPKPSVGRLEMTKTWSSSSTPWL